MLWLNEMTLPFQIPAVKPPLLSKLTIFSRKIVKVHNSYNGLKQPIWQLKYTDSNGGIIILERNKEEKKVIEDFWKR